MNISYVLHDITSRIKTMLGDRTASFLPVILIHKKDVVIERNRNDFDEIVSMSFKDFFNLVKTIKMIKFVITPEKDIQDYYNSPRLSQSTLKKLCNGVDKYLAKKMRIFLQRNLLF